MKKKNLAGGEWLTIRRKKLIQQCFIGGTWPGKSLKNRIASREGFGQKEKRDSVRQGCERVVACGPGKKTRRRFQSGL